MPNGIMIIDKPQGWTSHDVVAKLRGILGERRIGHAGTLDPMATGVLPIFVGRATRAVEFAAEGDKEYIAGLRLGVTTDTQDITGTVLETAPVSVSKDKVEDALTPFRGEIMQVPPMYSAIKKNGKKLYELARAGKEVDRPSRPVTIHELTLLEQQAPTDFLLRVGCSKGTYVRTLCHDIGASLGIGGCLFSLRRTRAAGFSLEDAVTMDTLMGSDAPHTFLQPVDSYFSAYPPLTVSEQETRKVKNGMHFSSFAPDGLYRVYSQTGEFLMLGRAMEGNMSTMKSFYEVE